MRRDKLSARCLKAIFISLFAFGAFYSCATMESSAQNPSVKQDVASQAVNNQDAPSLSVEDKVRELETLYREKRYEEAMNRVEDYLRTKASVTEFHLMKARVLAETRNEQEALDYLTEVIATYPANFSLLAARGWLLFKFGYMESARKDYLAAYENDYKTIDVLTVLLNFENERENYSGALKIVKEALELESDNGQLWFNKAQLEIRLGDIESAELSSFQAIQLRDDIQFQQLYYEILSFQKKKRKAFAFIEDLHQKLPMDTWVVSRYSAELISRNEHEKAKTALYDIIQSKPYESQLLFQLASIFFYEKNWPQAVEYLTAGLKINSEATNARIELAKVYFQLEENDKALEQLNLARKHGARDPFVYETLARYYNLRNDTFESERIIFEGLEISPRNFNLILEYARILEKRSKYKEAIKAYEEVLKTHADEVNIIAKLGHLNRLAGIYDEADTYFQKALELKPDSAWIRSYYTELLLDQEKWEDALSEVKHILTISPKDYWALAQKAQIEYRLGDFQVAYESINQSITIRPELTQLKRIKAEILERLNRFEMSREAYVEVLRDMPENSYVQTRLAYVLARLESDEALKTIESSLNEDDFDIAAIELYLYLTDRASGVWEFNNDESREQIYEAIILKKFSEAERYLLEARVKDQARLDFLEIFLSLIDDQRSVDINSDKLEARGDLTAWNFFYLGMIALEKLDYEAASRFFKKGLELDPENIWLKVKLAYAYQQLESHEAAISLLIEYLDKTPFKESVWARLRLALNYDLSKQYRKAEKVYLEILGLNPDESLALNNLAWMYLTTVDPEMKKKEEALNLALKAVELNATAANLDTLAEAYFQNEEYQKALKTIEKALDKDKNNIDDFKKTQKKILKALESLQD